MEITPFELSEMVQAVSADLADKTRIVAGYEVKHKAAVLATKRAVASAVVLLKDDARPSMVKLMIENHPLVIEATDKEAESEALLLMGKAELDGLTAQFQGLKKCLELKIEELRCFKG